MLVVLLRDDSDPAAIDWLSTLTARGHAVLFVPVLTTAPAMNASELCTVICEEKPLPWAIALTSRHAAAALATALLFNIHLSIALANTRIFCIGARTIAELAGSCLADRIETIDTLGVSTSGESGAAALATALLDAAATVVEDGGIKKMLNVLFLCGDTRLDVLPTALADGPLICRERVVYTSTPRLIADIKAAAAAIGPKSYVIVAFSPSGLSSAFDAGLFSDVIPHDLIALGATTAAAARVKGLLVAGVASSPTPMAVADVLARLEE
jgi:uroporphyrinogen-III synthase